MACKSGNKSISAPHSQLMIGKRQFKCLSAVAFSISEMLAIPTALMDNGFWVLSTLVEVI
jgi:hypothetical protein